jgi:hypothetical protein
MATPPEEPRRPSAQDVARHHQMRMILRKLNDKLTRCVPPGLLREIGGSLGWVGASGTLHVPCEDAVGPFLDLCVHTGEVGEHAFLAHFRLRQGETGDPMLAPDEYEMLDLLEHAEHVVLRVEAQVADVGVHVTDALTGGTRFLMDQTLSREPDAVGVWVAAHLIPVGAFFMTTGALVTLGRLPTARMRGVLEQVRGSGPGSKMHPRHVARVVTALGLRVTLGAPTSMPSGRPPSAKGPGRNAPCPCGSGKKYKRCCGG